MAITPDDRPQTTVERSNPNSRRNLIFYSTADLERALDGSEERFADYFFAIYRCSPDWFGPEDGVNEHRKNLREQFPAKVITIGNRFILIGQPAWLALSAYYQGLGLQTPRDDFRAYAKERVDDVTKAHRDSQSLPMPIDLSEGQLAGDRQMAFLTRVALSNGQIFQKPG